MSTAFEALIGEMVGPDYLFRTNNIALPVL